MRKPCVTRTFYTTKIFGLLLSIQEDGSVITGKLNPITAQGDISEKKAKMERLLHKEYGHLDGTVAFAKCEVESVLRRMDIETFIKNSEIVASGEDEMEEE